MIMPSSSISRNGIGKQTYTSNGALVGTFQAVVDFRSQSRTDTVRRVKPVDLFKNGTQFGVNETMRSCGLASTLDSTGVYRYTGPEAYWRQCYSNDLIPEDLTFNGLDGRMRSDIKMMETNLGQSFAEYRQAGALFSDSCRAVYSAFRGLRSGTLIRDLVRDLRNPRNKRSKDLANAWLQTQYGFKPLVSDVFGVVNTLNSKLLNTKQIRRTVRSSEIKYVTTTFPNALRPSERLVFDQWKRVSKKVVARYDYDQGLFTDLTRFGITNPALLVWELIPYSFVVDWLIPVGKYLESLDALNGVKNLVVLRSYKVESVRTSGTCKEHTIVKMRFAPSTSLSLPRLTYKPSQSLTAVVNGLGLIRQLR